jgi:hypothetical protein
MLGLIVSYLACAIAMTVGCIYPYIAFIVYVAFAILKPSEMWFWSLSNANLSAIAFIGMFIGWIFRLLGNWKLGAGTLPLLCLLGFWIWTVMSWCNATATYHPSVVDELRHIYSIPREDVGLSLIIALGKIIFPCFIGATLLDTPAKVYGLLWTMVLSAGYLCLEMNLAYLLDGYNRIYEEGFGGFDNNCIAVSFVSLTVPTWLLAFRSQNLWLKALALILGLLNLHTLLLSFSRGGMIALVFSLCVAFLVVQGGWKKYLALLLFIAFALRLAGPELRERFMTIFEESENLDASAKSRLELWKDCLDVISKMPLFGIGPENWPFVAPAYGWPEGKEAHSLWLQVGAETGVPGLILLLGYYISTGWRLYRHRFSDSLLMTIRDGLLPGLAGFMLAAQFVSIELLETPYYFALCGVGALRFARENYFHLEHVHVHA